MSDSSAKRLSLVALGISLLALVFAGYALHMQLQAEERMREVGEELERTLSPQLDSRPPLGLELDDR